MTLPPDSIIGELYLVTRLVIAALLGGLVGFERERSHKMAGLRTHMLVCVGAAMFTVISVEGFLGWVGNSAFDPSRIISNIVVGIGFIGAGAILRRNSRVEGITTAASLWTVAAIGIAVGLGFYGLALYGAVIVYFILYLVRQLEYRFQVSEDKEQRADEE